MAFNSRGCPIRSPSLTIIKQVSGSCISLYPHLSRTDFILASFFHLPCYLPRIFVSAPKEGAASAPRGDAPAHRAVLGKLSCPQFIRSAANVAAPQPPALTLPSPGSGGSRQEVFCSCRC